LATARQHADLADRMRALAERTAATRIALVHGDVSPKNILIGPRGPIFLDAECAWYGDPAFDAAFCLNHFLLKCVARPETTPDYLACYRAFSASYLAGATWEDVEALGARIASLLPALFLARVDGKSPVEYITEERDKQMVRDAARPLIANAPTSLDQVLEAWVNALSSRTK
ncbi:MAG TPA: phosphotransferase, partial [Casimicrobiaceae bacterium]|nr:phosphotransferase [Casimicrobiaceae bacterium]